jgi:PPOX class probable F420-dependent enzyme
MVGGVSSSAMSDELTVPEDLAYLLTTDHIGHVASIRPDGTIATHLMWVDWDGEHVLTSSPVGSRKGSNWRANPHASVSVVDRDDDWRNVIVRGRVTEIRPDTDLEFIDRMSQRYTGAPYRRRDWQREVFVITPDHVTASRGGWARRRR